MTKRIWTMACCLGVAGLAGAQGESTPAVRGDDAFALELYDRLRATPGNLFFAPHSVRTALAMTWAGARGQTATQMAEVLHTGPNTDAVHAALGDLALGVQVDDAEGGCLLSTANSLWGQRGELFRQEFLSLCADHYGAGFGQLDFAREAEAARATINGWVADQTRERIPELLKKGDIDAATVLVLTNAVDFQGAWAQRFDSARTAERPFWLLPSEVDDQAARSVAVPTMATTGRFGYHEDDAVQVLELPYAGDALSMVVVLPRERAGIADLEAGLDPEKLSAWVAALAPRQVVVHLPRFAARTARHLDEDLQALGMVDAFSPRAADFSGMNGKRDLFIGLVVHEACVNVDEEGTEASGATAVVMKRGARPLAFVADHPFLFLIRDRRSGAILFLGRIVDPTAG